MTTTPPIQRCAIYTRKSSEEGLEQEFNSLDAQREAALAYIESQRHEGWQPVDDHYDDGGFSGGNLQRPALQRLLNDIEQQRVDTVVVYKIDRLTRSLADFARLVELFDQHKLSFVAVTQQFNTTTSMGRLTLNILLSFAQFERELTSERIRDKFALARQKGKWMGGVPPLGYQVVDRKLVVQEDEANVVRQAFALFIETGSALLTCQRLNELGYRTRATISRTGRPRGGKRFTPGYFYKLLHNRAYLGEVCHKEQWYPGEHTALLHPDVWQQAHEQLNQGVRRDRRAQVPDAPLKGLLFDEQGVAVVASHTRRKGKRHRYYLSSQSLKHGYEQAPFPPIPAEPLERLVIELIRELLISPQTTHQVCALLKASQPTLNERDVSAGLQSLHQLWPELHPEEQQQLMQLLVARIDIERHQLKIQLHCREVLAALPTSQTGGNP